MFILFRADDPDERLQINHILRLQIALVATNRFGEFEQIFINLPGRARFIFGIKAVFAGGVARRVWFEKNMLVLMGDETEDGHVCPS